MRNLILVVFITLFGFVKAQNSSHINPFNDKDFVPCHDFRIGIGAVAYENFETPSSYGYYPVSSPEKIIDFDSKTYYNGIVFTNGIITANYTYQLKSWLGIGLSASYVSFYNDLLDAETDAIVGSGMRNRLAIYPQVRLTWYKNNILNLYSELGIGVNYIANIEKLNGKETTLLTNTVSSQLTLIGISFGKNIYCYSNIGYGNAGYFGLGLGYHFNIKN